MLKSDKMPIPSLLHPPRKLLPDFMLPHFHLFFLFSSACFLSSFISHDISLKPNSILYITPLRNQNRMRLQSLIYLLHKRSHIPQEKSFSLTWLKIRIKVYWKVLKSSSRHVNVSNIGVAEAASTQLPCDPVSILSRSSEMTDKWRVCTRLISHVGANRGARL